MIVGLTGGIGSGKSTVAGIFRHLGIAVFEADQEAKALLDHDKTLRDGLFQLLGPEVFGLEGRVDRSYMARRIFSDGGLLEKVNALIHPAVGRAFGDWYARQNSPYVLREAAILYESGSYRDCVAVIVVSAPENLRLERVMKRSGETAEQVRERMKSQWPQEQKDRRADYIIRNDGSQMIIPQVLKVHESLIRPANG
jgi:dephospho-CoA kinase